MFFTYSCLAAPTLPMSSDASGLWGCAAVWSEHWLQWKGSIAWRDCTITAKKCVPVLLPSVAWFRLWYGECIQFRCNNNAVVSAFRNYSCHEKLVMHLLGVLTFVAAQFSFNWQAIHIQGKSNEVADALSRNNLLTTRFYQQRRSAPDQVSVQLLAV